MGELVLKSGHKSSADPISRRQFIQWLGLMGSASMAACAPQERRVKRDTAEFCPAGLQDRHTAW